MMKRAMFLVLALALAVVGVMAESGYTAVSATDTSQTITFVTPRAAVTVCNRGSDEIYFRLFNETDTPAAATTANAYLASGACLEYSKPVTQPNYYKAISIICDSSETATVDLYSN